jgi:cell division protein FtsQ
LAISTSHHAERSPSRGVVRASIAAAAITALILAGVALSRSALFAVDTIDVTGASRVSTARVIARGHLDEPTNALWLDERAVERRLERHPWISDARVSVALPSTVRVAVVERTPLAVATDRFGAVYVAADGTALGRADDDAGLPLIESTGGRDAAAAALGVMPAGLRAAVASVTVIDDGSLEIRLHDDSTVKYGSAERLAAKALVLARILAWADANGEQLTGVDVSAPGAPAVAFS